MKIKENYNVGKAKYVVSYYDGKKHPDGSDFYDVAIFKSKKKKDAFIEELLARGTIVTRAKEFGINDLSIEVKHGGKVFAGCLTEKE